MAKEEIHNYIRTLLALAVIVFAGGGYAMKINSNSAAIEKVDVKADENRERIHESELVQTSINTKLDAIPRIERDIEKLTDHLMKFDYDKPEKDK